jgi:hypothetical protein
LTFHNGAAVVIDGRAQYLPKERLPANVLAAADEELFEFRQI